MPDENLDMFSHDNALVIAKKEVMLAARDKGCGCPVCGQYVKVYKRQITSTMARQLIMAFHLYFNGAWFHTKDIILENTSGPGDFSKMEYWGLIERQKHVAGDGGKRTSGLWRVTSLGYDFIHGGIKLRKSALVYNGKLLSLTGGLAGIRDTLGNHFDYNTLMEASCEVRT